MSNHAFLAPSSAHKWVYCAAAPTLEAMYPQEETDATREGDAAHWLAEMIAKTPEDQLLGMSEYVGQSAPNGVITTEEMYFGALEYRNAVYKYSWDEVHFEKKVRIPRIHATHCEGTSDCYAIDRKRKTFYVIDYKFGHRSVKAFENWQLMCYAAGVLYEEGVDIDWEWSFCFTIVQPRGYHSNPEDSTWVVNASLLRTAFNDLAMAAELATQLDPKTRPGLHCLDCSARVHCSSFKDFSTAAIDICNSATPLEINNEELGYELIVLRDAIKVAKTRFDSMIEEAEIRARRSERVAGHEMKPGKSNRIYNVPDDVVIQAVKWATNDAIDLTEPTKAATPAQAEQKLKANNISLDIIKPYIHKPKAAMKLQPIDKARTAAIIAKQEQTK